MSPKTQNPQKKFRKDLQKFYTFYFTFALGVCALLLALIVASISSLIKVNAEIGLLIFGVILVLFLPFSLFMKFKNMQHKLKSPGFLPERVVKIIRYSASILYIVVFVYGILVYFYGPIKPDANLYTDKLGRIYSYNEFLVFQKWEFTLIISFCIAALQGVIFLPISDAYAKKFPL